MGCTPCQQKRAAGKPSPQAAVTAGSRVLFTVVRDGRPTGRDFTSIVSAQRYADAITGATKVIPK